MVGTGRVVSNSIKAIDRYTQAEWVTTIKAIDRYTQAEWVTTI